ncbi:hypothetical protein PAT3040_03961 [Paenibacillus agaridevorans]|uniref:Lipoprotein n=1 Tax=Paenibacillus agaridevorans TaxID=171404 RepID=A0A2R5ERX8_9BACL|nr:hypothetical protein [Paenibacillus agaridevorans]GBG09317.1 hypothetical protein PAT3040_03961 [Paenibacillus agaridevorans]
MNSKKNKILKYLVFILIALTILSSCEGNDMNSEKGFNNLSKLIEQKNFDDLSLTIYFISPSILTRAPLSVDDLINFDDVKNIVISGSDLEEHMDLFEQITKVDLIPVKIKSRVNARLYYFFEIEKKDKILDVAMWGKDSSVFINGLEVKGNSIFYDIVMPFLPTDEFKTYPYGIK